MTLKKPESFITDEGRKFLSKAGKKGWDAKKKKRGLTDKKARAEYFRELGLKGLKVRKARFEARKKKK